MLESLYSDQNIFQFNLTLLYKLAFYLCLIIVDICKEFDQKCRSRKNSRIRIWLILIIKYTVFNEMSLEKLILILRCVSTINNFYFLLKLLIVECNIQFLISSWSKNFINKTDETFLTCLEYCASISHEISSEQFQ